MFQLNRELFSSSSLPSSNSIFHPIESKSNNSLINTDFIPASFSFQIGNKEKSLRDSNLSNIKDRIPYRQTPQERTIIKLQGLIVTLNNKLKLQTSQKQAIELENQRLIETIGNLNSLLKNQEHELRSELAILEQKYNEQVGIADEANLRRDEANLERELTCGRLGSDYSKNQLIYQESLAFLNNSLRNQVIANEMLKRELRVYTS